MAFHYSAALPLATASLTTSALHVKKPRLAVCLGRGEGSNRGKGNYQHSSPSPGLRVDGRSGLEPSPRQKGRGRRGGEELTDADTKGPNAAASGLYLCLCEFPVAKVGFFFFFYPLNTTIV